MLFRSRAQETIARYADWLSAEMENSADGDAPWVGRQLTLVRKAKEASRSLHDKEPAPPTRKEALATVRNGSAALTGDPGMGLSRLLLEASRRDLRGLVDTSHRGSPHDCPLPLLFRGVHFEGPTLSEGNEAVWVASFLPQTSAALSAPACAIALIAYHLHTRLADWDPCERDGLIRRFLTDHFVRGLPVRLRIDGAEALPPKIVGRLLPLAARPHSLVFAGADSDWLSDLPKNGLFPRYRLDALSPYAIRRFCRIVCGSERSRTLLHWIQDHGEAAQLAAHPRFLAMLAQAAANETFAPGASLPEVFSRELNRRLRVFPASTSAALRGFLGELAWTKPEALTLAHFEERAADFLKQTGLGELRAFLGAHEPEFQIRKQLESNCGLLTLQDTRLRFTEGWGDFLRATHLADIFARTETPERVMLHGERGLLTSSLGGMASNVAWHPLMCLLAGVLEEANLRWLNGEVDRLATAKSPPETSLLQCRLALVVAQRFENADPSRLRLKWWDLGDQLGSMDRWSEALACLRTASTNGKEHPLEQQQEDDLMRTRLLAEVYTGHVSQAVRFMKAFQREYENEDERLWILEIHRTLGTALVSLERATEAVAVLEWAAPKAIDSPYYGDLHPTTLSIHCYLGLGLVMLDRHSEAFSLLEWAAPKAVRSPQCGELNFLTLEIHRWLCSSLVSLHKFAKAVPILQWGTLRAVQSLQCGEFSRITLSLHHLLGASLVNLDRNTEAVPILEWAAPRAVQSPQCGELHEITLDIHRWLAMAYLNINRDAEAVTMLQWAAPRALQSPKFGEFDSTTLSIFHSLGLALVKLNRFGEALPILRWAAPRAVGSASCCELAPLTLKVHATLGRALISLNRNEEAVNTLKWSAERAIESPQCDEVDPITLEINLLLGLALINLSHHVEALPILQRTAANAVESPQCGEFHIITLDAHHLLGRALIETNREAESIPILQWAAQRAVRSPQCGELHFTTINIYRWLGIALVILNRPADAVPILQWAAPRAINSAECGELNFITVEIHYYLGEALSDLNRHADAIPPLQWAAKRAIRSPNFGELHETTIMIHYSLGLAFLEVDQKEDAISTFQRAAPLAVRSPKFGETDFHTLDIHRWLGCALVMCNRCEEALPILQWTAPRAAKYLGDSNSVTLDSYRLLGSSLVKLCRHSEAVSILQWAAPRAINSAQYGEFHVRTIDIHRWLGTTLIELKRFAEAIPALNWALPRAEKGLGKEHFLFKEIKRLLDIARNGGGPGLEPTP
ncbi:MAG: tetratricopeptide repeat protein [Opitutales bacterium]|nr:tetratricopeptide repeat protein [Opitutales bacterium]